MKKSILGVVLLTSLILVGCGKSEDTTKQSSKIDELESKVDTLESKATASSTSIENNKSKVEQIVDDMKESGLEIYDLNLSTKSDLQSISFNVVSRIEFYTVPKSNLNEEELDKKFIITEYQSEQDVKDAAANDSTIGTEMPDFAVQSKTVNNVVITANAKMDKDIFNKYADFLKD